MHLRSKVGTDEVTVSGLRTLVLTRGTARRPRNVLEKIEMAGDATPPAEMSHEEWLRRLQHCLIGALDRGKAERKLDDETLRVINSLRKHQDMEPLDAAEAYEQADASHNQSRNSQSA